MLLVTEVLLCRLLLLLHTGSPGRRQQQWDVLARLCGRRRSSGNGGLAFSHRRQTVQLVNMVVVLLLLLVVKWVIVWMSYLWVGRMWSSLVLLRRGGGGRRRTRLVGLEVMMSMMVMGLKTEIFRNTLFSLLTL